MAAVRDSLRNHVFAPCKEEFRRFGIGDDRLSEVLDDGFGNPGYSIRLRLFGGPVKGCIPFVERILVILQECDWFLKIEIRLKQRIFIRVSKQESEQYPVKVDGGFHYRSNGECTHPERLCVEEFP
jgi:hypothetical protein